MGARERAVQVVARAMCDAQNPSAPQAWANYRDEWLRDAGAVVAALESRMGLLVESRPMQHEGDGFANDMVRQSLAAAFAKWPDFGHEERLVTDWVETPT